MVGLDPVQTLARPALSQRDVLTGTTSLGPESNSVMTQFGVGTPKSVVVTGRGKARLEPDLALVNIGVETYSNTVSRARDSASRTMDEIVKAITVHGVVSKDIQTRSFNIWPNYDYQEDFSSDGGRTSRRILSGYTVSNTVTIKIRNLDKVGEIIDDGANAGGDATRIDGVSFTVENVEPFMASLREDAVKDAVAKAEHFAAVAGVTLGDLMFLSESGTGTPRIQSFGSERMAFAAADPVSQTSISGGELELTIAIQTAFAIE